MPIHPPQIRQRDHKSVVADVTRKLNNALKDNLYGQYGIEPAYTEKELLPPPIALPIHFDDHPNFAQNIHALSKSRKPPYSSRSRSVFGTQNGYRILPPALPRNLSMDTPGDIVDVLIKPIGSLMPVYNIRPEAGDTLNQRTAATNSLIPNVPRKGQLHSKYLDILAKREAANRPAPYATFDSLDVRPEAGPTLNQKYAVIRSKADAEPFAWQCAKEVDQLEKRKKCKCPKTSGQQRLGRCSGSLGLDQVSRHCEPSISKIVISKKDKMDEI